ncbi:unnamed protein product, partial [Mesorhabditis belari]|uniref:Uncharacterized protein n=1 Tax=Mesorhabditis belari TaxID=2138241 RepID=A0AAF3FKV8_9BILA
MLIRILQLYVLIKTISIECLISSLKFFIPIGWYPRKRIQGQTILLTGAANGIGRRLAQKLAKCQTNLILWDVDTKNLERTRLLCQGEGAQIAAYDVDITNQKEVNRALEEIISEFGPIDILINNAGKCSFTKFVDMTRDRLQTQILLNFVAPMMLIKAILPSMMERNHGHIVATCSSRALVGKGIIADYSAEKQALLGLMESLEDEMCLLGKRGIKFTTVCPMLTKTNMTKPLGDRFPLLAPEVVAEYYLDAILCEKRLAVIPRRSILSYWLKCFLPAPVYQLFT